MSIENSHFENNIGKRYGGAVSILNHSVLNISSTTFKNNTKKFPFNLNIVGIQTIYQAFYRHVSLGGGAAILLIQSVGTISKSVFYNNFAHFTGGTRCIANKSSLSISHTTFENNVADVIGGAISSYHSFLNVEYSNFKNNSVLNKKLGGGGCLYLLDNSTAKISKVLFTECHANHGGTITANLAKIIMADSSLTANTGSALYLFEGVFIEINNCTFSNNSTPHHGGAITCIRYCDVKAVNVNFKRNRALISGGAIHMETSKCAKPKECGLSKLTVHNCSFTHNTAYTGGAMLLLRSKFSISNSNCSNNTATKGGVFELIGNTVMTNCRIINNTAHASGGAIRVVNGSLQMSYCLVSNNTANSNGGVVASSGSEIIVTNCIFKMNSVLGVGGVFCVEGGTTVLRKSLLMKNMAELDGGVFFLSIHSEINITQSRCFANQAKNFGGVLASVSNSKVFISDTEISQNSGNVAGAIWIDGNSVLELSGSQIVNNSAQDSVGALYISNNSLLVTFNSSFEGNKAYEDSSLQMKNSTAYLEKCTFMESYQTSYGGTIGIQASVLKVANTFFEHNTGYDIYYYQTIRVYFINRLDTYRCMFKHDNFSLKSNMNFFEQIAIRKNIISNISTPFQVHTALQETPYASSKMFIYLPTAKLPFKFYHYSYCNCSVIFYVNLLP